MKTIVLVVYSDNERAGGSVRIAETLARALPGPSVDVHAIVAYGSGGRLKRILGSRCHLVRAAGPRDVGAWIRYRKLLRRLRPDIVHYVDCVGWMIVSGARIARVRVGHQHFRPSIGPTAARRYFRIRWLAGTADKVIAISHGAAQSLIADCGVSPGKVAVVHNGIDEHSLEAVSKPQTERCTVLGMAARIVEDKGFEDALCLLEVLPSRFHLAIAGEGPARARMERLVDEKGLQERVRWLGSLVNIAEFYASIDFYLFLSWYEGFGLAVAEAMACGVPVVGLLGDGEIAEEAYPLVTDTNSVLVSRSNPCAFGPERSLDVIAKLAVEIVSLADDLPRRNHLSDQAKEWVCSRFSSQVFASKVMGTYQSALDAVLRRDNEQ